MRTLLAVLTLASATTALAADEPGAYGMAQRGSFKLVAGVLLSPKGGERKGVWLDAKQGCLERRALRVAISIDLVDSRGRTSRVRRTRQGLVTNCAEGGPNFGFDLVPHRLGLGCVSGRWKSGRYSMSTRVTDVQTQLLAQASLYRQVTRTC
jgi:hypothetical protein